MQKRKRERNKHENKVIIKRIKIIKENALGIKRASAGKVWG